jgi:hypothetical protein
MPSLVEYYFRTILRFQKTAAEIGLSSLRRAPEGSFGQTTPRALAGLSEQRSSAMPQQELTEEQIRRRAYDIWLQEGRPQGRDKENWERAKVEIESKRAWREPRPMPDPSET